MRVSKPGITAYIDEDDEVMLRNWCLTTFTIHRAVFFKRGRSHTSPLKITFTNNADAVMFRLRWEGDYHCETIERT